MPDGIVELGNFDTEAKAWLARAVLEANGIVSEVVTEHGISLVAFRNRLAVRAEDAEAARKILGEASPTPSA